MNPRWEQSEYVFCDLQAAARFIRRNNFEAASAFLEAAYNAFEFLAKNPGIGRKRVDLGFPDVRSWRIAGFRTYLIFYRESPEGIQIWRVLHSARDLHQHLED
jgi:toxin ParE1/3/4